MRPPCLSWAPLVSFGSTDAEVRIRLYRRWADTLTDDARRVKHVGDHLRWSTSRACPAGRISGWQMFLPVQLPDCYKCPDCGGFRRFDWRCRCTQCSYTNDGRQTAGMCSHTQVARQVLSSNTLDNLLPGAAVGRQSYAPAGKGGLPLYAEQDACRDDRPLGWTKTPWRVFG